MDKNLDALANILSELIEKYADKIEWQDDGNKSNIKQEKKSA